MSTIQPCPSCGKIISFVSTRSAYRVCDCGKVIRQKESGSLSSTEERAVTEFPELIQPGTTGTFSGKKFVVNGRLRIRFEESVINYWDISFNDSNQYWLMEGYGMYGILKRNDAINLPFPKPYSNLSIGTTIGLPDTGWICEEKDQIAEMAFEGEVELGDFRKNAFIYSFSSAMGEKLIVMEWENNQCQLFELEATSFAALQFKQLREPQLTPKKFECKECKASITVELFPYSGSVVCPGCSMQYVYRFAVGFIKEKKLKYNIDPVIPIGTEGEIKGIRYKVMSYAEKTEMENEDVLWREYTLYNPQEGFAFLSEYAGHWIYLREKLKTPVLIKNTEESFNFENEPFILFNKYRARVVAARGEFPYNAFDDSQAAIREYISPPEMWIWESNVKEGICWYHAEHISSTTLQKAFGITAMPPRIGVGAIQPTGYINKYKVVVATIVGIILLALLHHFIGNTKEQKVLIDESFVLADSVKQTFVFPPFDLTKSSSNLEIDFNAAVNNSWFEIAATLVNTKTGQEFSVEKGVEYYTGTEDGQIWTEGSTRDQAYISALPAGNYILQLQTSRDTNFVSSSSFFLKVTYDVSNGRNMWWAIVLLLLWPLYRLLKDFFQETRRWNNSPVTPNE